jgi:hypothetical protein
MAHLRHARSIVDDVPDLHGSDRVPTWRDGVILTSREKAELTAEQWRQYLDDSVVRDLAEIDTMPEPTRSWARQAVEQARARAEAHIAGQGSREAS